MAADLASTSDSLDGYDLSVETKAVLDSYEMGRQMFANLPTDIVLAYLNQTLSGKSYSIGLLRQVAVECGAAIGYLQTLSSPISSADKDRLESLRQEISLIESFDSHLFTHVSEAITEYEDAHYLASALLASKSIAYVWEQLPGKTSEEKVSRLLQAKLIKQNLKEQFLRAEKKARNYFTHDISAIPQPQEALAMVADACNLAVILMKLTSPRPS
jgi:hypothetical protein